MKKNVFLFLTAAAAIFYGCSDDDSTTPEAVKAAFITQAVNLSSADTNVPIAFSVPATAAGTVTVTLEPTNVVYGTDFTTNPAASGATVTIPFSEGANGVSLTFTKIIDAIEGQTKNVKFTISAISITNAEIPTATNYTQLNFNETAITQNTTIAENGGNTIPNQVYVDLSSGAETAIARTAWELGFHSGSAYRVVLNSSINKLAVKQLATSNIDEVQTADPSVTTGDYNPAGAGYIDNPYGNLSGTAIAEISANDADNKVYLVNLGQAVSTTPATGTGAALTGTDRGWKKIRILRNGADYKLQYANIDATTHTEVIITKNAAFNHTFFSLITGTTVNGEPQREKWDFTLTPFMNYTQYNGQDVSYYYGDVVITNNLAGTRAYEVLTSAFTYDAFTLANVVTANFDATTSIDKRVIGANWRATFPAPSVRTDRFYVIKDAAGNIYKLKFTSMLSGSSERGTTTFEYTKLN